jgi:signal transduction histidine kinase
LADRPKVLVIDDEDAARYGIVRALSAEGYQLEEASDGQSALTRIQEFQPDVVLSDINMPGMDGLSLLSHIQNGSGPDIPLVVLITAYGSEETAIRALRLGAYNYIAKPFEVADLRVIIRNAVDKQRLLRENRHYVEELRDTLAELRRSQTELVHAQKMAALGRLVAGIAHEINTPLGVMQGSVGVIESAVAKLKTELSPDIQGRAERYFDALPLSARQLQTAIQRVAAIVANLRKFAQLDRGDQQKAQIQDGLESTLKLVEHQFSEHIQVVREFGELPEIECSPRELNQVFLNLLLNARDAIEDAGRPGTIWLRTRRLQDSVQVEIEDNGCGISETDLPKIFDPGFTTKGVRVGTGLGLAISDQVVSAHGGRIEVVSRLGEGAKFTVSLPLRGSSES